MLPCVSEFMNSGGHLRKNNSKWLFTSHPDRWLLLGLQKCSCELLATERAFIQQNSWLPQTAKQPYRIPKFWFQEECVEILHETHYRRNFSYISANFFDSEQIQIKSPQSDGSHGLFWVRTPRPTIPSFPQFHRRDGMLIRTQTDTFSILYSSLYFSYPAPSPRCQKITNKFK